MNTKSSPLPWHESKEWPLEIEDADGQLIGDLGLSTGPDRKDRGNVDLTLRAVNAHADLVAACQRALEQLRNCDCSNGVTTPMGDIDEGEHWAADTMNQLHDAIVKATGTIPHRSGGCDLHAEAEASGMPYQELGGET